MRIHRGFKGQNRTPCRWIEPRTTWQFEVGELVEGLCSRYWRHRIPDDDPPPAHLSLAEVVNIAKEEHERYGTNATWTWSDGGDHVEAERARVWATVIILRVLPGLRIPHEEES